MERVARVSLPRVRPRGDVHTRLPSGQRGRERQRVPERGEDVTWVREQLERAKVTQRALASALGVSEPTVHRYLESGSVPTKHHEAMRKALGLSRTAMARLVAEQEGAYQVPIFRDQRLRSVVELLASEPADAGWQRMQPLLQGRVGR